MSNPLTQPPLPAPAAVGGSPTPPPNLTSPAAPKPPAGGAGNWAGADNFLNSFSLGRGIQQSGPYQFAKHMHGLSTPAGYDAEVARRTTSTPPLVTSGHVAPDGLAGSLLGGAQRLFQNRPETFASVMGTAGAPLLKPLLASGAGLPLLAGAYGMVAGGDSAAAANRFFKPLASRIGLGG